MEGDGIYNWFLMRGTLTYLSGEPGLQNNSYSDASVSIMSFRCIKHPWQTSKKPRPQSNFIFRPSVSMWTELHRVQLSPRRWKSLPSELRTVDSLLFLFVIQTRICRIEEQMAGKKLDVQKRDYFRLADDADGIILKFFHIVTNEYTHKQRIKSLLNFI